MPRVLVIDDNSSVLQTLEFLLQSEGYDVLSATDGPSGLRLAAEQAVDVVMLDIDMPKMSGIAVCAVLKSDPELSHLPVLMMTGRPTEEAIERAKSVGASIVLGKPFDLHHLRATIAELLRRPLFTPLEAEPSPEFCNFTASAIGNI